MRAVFDVVAGEHLTDEGVALAGLGVVTGFDGGFAGDGVKKLVAERLGVEGAPLQELAGQLGEGGFGIRGVHVAGHAA